MSRYFRMAVPTSTLVESRMAETSTAIATNPTGLTRTLALKRTFSLSEADIFTRWGWDKGFMVR